VRSSVTFVATAAAPAGTKLDAATSIAPTGPTFLGSSRVSRRRVGVVGTNRPSELGAADGPVNQPIKSTMT
jgi:hypothetical protein